MDTQSVELLDCTLRDGSYVIDFQFTAADTALVVSALDAAGIRLIEVGHGVGLGAARAGQGSQAATDREYLNAASAAKRNARVGMFFIPGIGTEDDLRMAVDHGLDFVRVGTNITELDAAAGYIPLAKSLGLLVFSNLMKSYAVPPAEFAARAKQAAGYGADIVCLVDSAGGMLPEDIRAYLETARETCGATLGFHGHDNLCLAVANSVAACEHGAGIVDGSLQGMGRSAGNAVTEVLAAVMQKRGWLPEVDVNALIDVGVGVIQPMVGPGGHSSFGITAGRARFHSSFLGRVLKAAAEFGVDARNLILRLCEVDQVSAPEELVRKLAGELAAEGRRPAVRAELPPLDAPLPGEFHERVRARAADLKAQARKLRLPAVLNVVLTSAEPASVSPVVETRYGCALSNVMLTDAEALKETLAATDGLADYVLLDAQGAEVDPAWLEQSRLLTYSDDAMWVRAVVSHVAALLGGFAAGKRLAVTGAPRLAGPVAAGFDQMGAAVTVCPPPGTTWVEDFAPGVKAAPFSAVLGEADAVLAISPRQPVITAAHVEQMRQDALLYDGGIGSLARAALAGADARGIRVVRVDLRPSLAAEALERIHMAELVSERMGRAQWDGVTVVAGGLIGQEGDVVVDSIAKPARVLGVADGLGGIRPPDPHATAVLSVRRHIANRLLGQE